MTTPAHLKELPLPIVLSLSKGVHDTGAMMQAVWTENTAFIASSTPHDASRVAKALRFLASTAAAAAHAYEAAREAAEKDRDDNS